MAEDQKASATVPFGVHQAIEYLLGVLAFTSIARLEPRSSAVCAGAGAALVVLAASSGERLGVVALVPPRVHRFLDWLSAILLASSPWWTGMGWSAGGVWIVEALAVVVLWLSRATVYHRRPPRPSTPRSSGPAEAATTTLPAAARSAGRLAGALGRKGPRAAGAAVGRMKKRRP